MSFFSCLIFLIALPFYLTSFEPFLYFTWEEDPTTSITVQWSAENPEENFLFYRPSSQEHWLKREGTFHIPDQLDLPLYQLHLSELTPDTYYELYLPQRKSVYRFHTLPQNLSFEKKVRFCVGGDVYRHPLLMKEMLKKMAKLDPDFIVLGGDLIYEHQPFFKKRFRSKKWAYFFHYWQEEMRREDGTSLPLLVTLGNHDVEKKRSSLFGLFPLLKQSKSYASFKVGHFLNLFLLDSGHVQPISGTQSEWLKETLKQSQDTPYKMVIYHVAAYPSVYDFNSSTSQEIRRYWIPLFESYNIQCAFEHHNHSYKRTYPLINNERNPKGILYCGDGCIGVSPRSIRPSHSSYLAQAAPLSSFWLVTLEEEEWTLESHHAQGRLEGFCFPAKRVSSLPR